MRRCIDTVIEDQAVGRVPAEHERKGNAVEAEPAAPPAEPAGSGGGRRRKPAQSEE